MINVVFANHLIGGSRDLGPGVGGRIWLHGPGDCLPGLRGARAQARTTWDARDRTQDRSGASFRGDPPPRRAPALLPHPGQGKGWRRTDSRGEQSFEAGVTAVSTGESRRARDRTDGRRAPARRWFAPQLPQETSVHDHAVACQTPGLTSRQMVSAVGKAVVKLPSASHRRRSTTNPQGRTRPTRVGTAPREGKAL